MKILLNFSYDGSKFHGFQRQKNIVNVQSEIEKALESIYGEIILIKGAGRTDAKVHAINQYAHYETEIKIKNIKKQLNQILKHIRIKKVRYVNDDFHARYSVKEKTYIYKLTLSKKDNKEYYGYYYGNVNYKVIKSNIYLFRGTHDFKNFVAGYRDNYVSTVNKVYTYKICNRIYFIFKGHGFYRYMVRNLVGAMIDLSKGKVTIKEVENMLNNPENEKKLSTAKAEGLYLKNIKY